MSLKSTREMVLRIVKSVDPIGVGPEQAEFEYDDLANFVTRQLESCQSFAQFQASIQERLTSWMGLNPNSGKLLSEEAWTTRGL